MDRFLRAIGTVSLFLCSVGWFTLMMIASSTVIPKSPAHVFLEFLCRGSAVVVGVVPTIACMILFGPKS
jgi:hypothetical protein